MSEIMTDDEMVKMIREQADELENCAAAMRAAGAEIDRLRLALETAHERIALDNAVCLCGCPADMHEDNGEDGEDCGEEGHECLRVAPAVLEIVGRYRVALSAALSPAPAPSADAPLPLPPECTHDQSLVCLRCRVVIPMPAPPADAAREAGPRGFPPSLIREATEEAKTWLSAPYSNHGPQAVVDARGIMFRLLSVIHEFTAASVLSISGMHDTCDLCQRDIPDGCYAVFCGECEDGMRAAFDGVKRALAPSPAPAPSEKEGRT